MEVSIRSLAKFGKQNLSVRRGTAATKMTCVENSTLEQFYESSAGVEMAGDRASRTEFAQRRLVGLAHRHGAGAAGVEAASGRRPQRARHLAGNDGPRTPCFDFGI